MLILVHIIKDAVNRAIEDYEEAKNTLGEAASGAELQDIVTSMGAGEHFNGGWTSHDHVPDAMDIDDDGWEDVDDGLKVLDELDPRARTVRRYVFPDLPSNVFFKATRFQAHPTRFLFSNAFIYDLTCLTY